MTTRKAIVPHISRGAAGIALGAALVMLVDIAAALIGRPLHDNGLGDAALWVSMIALGVWFFARFFDPERGP
jgi:hypothetical protein